MGKKRGTLSSQNVYKVLPRIDMCKEPTLLHNRLQHVLSLNPDKELKLPQIVMLGDQSSGKSSVLDGLVRRQFLPQGNKMVTKCPIVICLRKIEEVHTKRSIEVDNETEAASGSDELEPREYVEFGHRKGERLYDFDLVAKEIEDQMKNKVGDNGISTDPILLGVYSPNVVNLTLVDLPGLIANPDTNLPEDTAEKILRLVETYISNPNAIILAVCPANQDFSTLASVTLARKVDPTLKRTMIILTKLDIMDEGTDARDILSGTSSTVKPQYGTIGVVNRSNLGLQNKVSIEASLEKEEKFLRETYGPYLAKTNGTKYLEKTLSVLLMDHMVNCLPEFSNEINAKVKLYEGKLHEIGGDEEQPHKTKTLQHVIRMFCSLFVSELEGSTRNAPVDYIISAGRVRFMFSQDFAEQLSKINPLTDTTDLQILHAIINSRGARHDFFLPEDAYQTLMKEQILKIGICVQQCATDIHNEVLKTVKTCLDTSVERFPKLNTTIQAVVAEVLNERIKCTNDFLDRYIKIQASYTKSQEPAFKKDLESAFAGLDITLNGFPEKLLFLSQSKSTTKQINPEHQDSTVRNGEPVANGKIQQDLHGTIQIPENQKKKCDAVILMCAKYFDVVRKQIQDFIPRAVGSEYLDYIVDHVHDILIEKLYPHRAEDLIRVSEHIIQQREAIKQKLEKYQLAQRIIKESRELDIRALTDEDKSPPEASDKE